LKRVYCILVLLLLIGLTAGCSSTTSSGLPSHIVFAGSEMSSSFYVMSVGIGDLINRHTEMTVKVEAIGGATLWLPLFKSGEADLGLMNTADAYKAYVGLEPYKSPTDGQGFDFRTLQVGSPLLTGIFVRNDSDMETVSDLRGKKVPTGFGGNLAIQQGVQSLLANGGLSFSDIVSVPVSTGYGPDIRDAFVTGRIDCLPTSLGTSTVAEMDAAVGVRFLAISNTPDAVEAMSEIMRGSYAYFVEAGSFPGVTKDIYVRAHNITLVSRRDLSDDAIYEIMEAIWGNSQELIDVHPNMRDWIPNEFAMNLATVPYHPAAVDFFREKRVWNEVLEKRQEALLGIK